MPKKPLTKDELKVHPSAYGGSLRNRRRGRGRRTLSTYYSMHLVMRAKFAYGLFSFKTPDNERTIREILRKHSARTGVDLLGRIANAGNHLHLRIKVPGRRQYCRFIRAVTGEIALKLKRRYQEITNYRCGQFWSHRPFTAIVAGARYLAAILDYLEINHLEGLGIRREYARHLLKKRRDKT